MTTTTILSARCAAILESQRRFNAQIDAAEAAVRRFVPAGPVQDLVLAQLAAARARYNALLAQALASCSTGTPPPVTRPTSSTTPTTQAPTTTTTTTPSDPCSGPERRLFNAQIDAAVATFRGLLPPGPRLDARIAHFEAFRARGNALFDRLAGCT